MENKYTHFHTIHIYQNEINRNKRETADLKETRRLLQKAIKETDGPLKVTSECLFHREGRRVSISKKLNLFELVDFQQFLSRSSIYTKIHSELLT